MKTSILLMSTFFILTTLTAQTINQEIIDDNQQPFLVGPITIEALNSNSYQNWYSTNYKNYEVDLATIELIKEELAEYKIMLFMGTWCGDSKREVPRFIKILQAVDFPIENLKLIALDKRKDQYKKSPTGEEWGLNIKRVPTFIFYKNGKEINRIIESPITSLEADIKAVITKAPCTPNYAQSLHFD